jgi:hypothetical protein
MRKVTHFCFILKSLLEDQVIKVFIYLQKRIIIIIIVVVVVVVVVIIIIITNLVTYLDFISP